jgi:hypothetical protein
MEIWSYRGSSGRNHEALIDARRQCKALEEPFYALRSTLYALRLLGGIAGLQELSEELICLALIQLFVGEGDDRQALGA